MSDRRVPETPITVPSAVRRIVETLEGAGYESWCVGGALRDALLGVPHADFDVATAATPDRVRALFRRTVPVGEKHGTIGVLDDDGVLHEVTTFRRDVRTDGRHAEVEFGASLDDDLARRDFTINALAWHPLRAQWHDPFHGAVDLAARQLRAVGHPAARFREDYLRVLRALRFAARFDLAVESATWAALRDAVTGLTQLSAERIRDEWFKSLRTSRTVSRLVELWHESGAARVVAPGLRRAAGVEPALSSAPRDPVLLTVVLCEAPVGVLRRWRGSNAEVARARAAVEAPARPDDASARSVRHWLAAAGPAADDLLRLHELEHGTAAPWAAEVIAIRARGEPLTRDALALRGGDLMALGLSGPDVGRVLERLLQAVLDDPALNSHDALLQLAREQA